MAKTNLGLVEYARKQVGRPYWYGTFGNIASPVLCSAKKKQYPAYYTSWSDFPEQFGQRVHDCIGLVKGYLWSDTAASVPKYNARQDVSANDMLSLCKEKGVISSMPDIPGVLVFMKGHVGIYAGKGEVIEARGHEYGVVVTKLSERPWKNWGKCPFIEYDQKTTITVKKGTWNVRSGPGVSFKSIAVVKGGNVITYSKIAENGWRYLPVYKGWISPKGID